jgi:FtsZ-interacting cell division protein YlmF
MAFLEKLRSLVGVEEEEFDDYLDEEPIQPTPKPSSYGLGDRNMTIGRDKPLWAATPMPKPQPASLYHQEPMSRRPFGENVADTSPGSKLRALTQRFRIVVVEPKVFDDSKKLVDDLKARKPVIINLENVERGTARKIFDFLGGATYALSGNVQKITNNIFVFLPENVDVSTSTERDSVGFGASDGGSWQR